MTREEIETLKAHFTETLGKPTKLEEALLSPRWAKLGVEAYAEYLGEVGYGAYGPQQILTVAPDLLDDFLQAAGLPERGIAIAETAVVFHDPFGSCTLRTRSGDTILIHAIQGGITVMTGGERLSAAELELEFASDLQYAIEEAGEEQLIGVDGKNLRVAASRRLGSLGYGQCYGFFPTINTGGNFDAANLEIVPLQDQLLFLHTMQSFEISTIDLSADLPPEGELPIED